MFPHDCNYCWNDYLEEKTMLDFSQASLINLFSEYAYQPMHVYTLIVLFMFASSFGLPIPEELVLLAAGLVAYIAKDPINFPPPSAEAVGVNVTVLSFVCFFSVFISDLTVYLIEKYFGVKLIKTKYFREKLNGNIFNKINEWFKRYGGYACGIFRFIPGLRFAGHMSCGLMGIPLYKFILIDGGAALISVPTQVYFVATYGDVVLERFKEFKIAIVILILISIIFYISKKFLKRT